MSSDKKKPSGFFYRKRKAQEALQNEKQSSLLKKFFTATTTSASTDATDGPDSTPRPTPSSSNTSGNGVIEITADEEEIQARYEESEVKDDDDSHSDSPNAMMVGYEEKEEEDEGSNNTNHLTRDSEDEVTVSEEVLNLSHDPGEWPTHINDAVRQRLVKRGPEQVTHIDFPLNEDNRRFSEIHYCRRLKNGEEVSRPWLIYSVKKNVVYCFCCRLFGKSTHSKSLSSESGNNAFRHISELLSDHEKSPKHMRAYSDWIECCKRVKAGKTIDKENQKLIEKESERWKEVMKRIVLVVEFLASQNLAFRGNADRLYARNNGNFLKLVEFIGQFDATIAEHLRRIQSKETYVHYLGKSIQNELIELLGSKTKDHILKEIQKSTYYSVILDCTPDVSHTEQLSLTVRYVTCESEKEPTIQERFLGFVPIECSTGEALTETLLRQLEDLKLPLHNMRGQGYDNGANMKGKHAGVQNRILNLNPRAFFVPCSAHSLNLVVNDAALSCLEAVNFFGTIQEMYKFFSASTHRWSVLKNHVATLTLKPLSETRWSSRIDAINPLRYQAGEVYDALLELSTDSRSDAFGKNAALSLARKLKSFKFVSCLVLWHTILSRINVVSKLLQKENLDISKAVEMIDQIKKYFQEIRNDKGFEEILVDAREVAESLDVEPTFEKETKVRPRKVKKHFDYEVEDEHTEDLKEAFKRDVYFYVMDRTLSSLEERFTQLKQHKDVFGFMHVALNQDITSKEKKDALLKSCGDLQIILTDGAHADIDGYQLYQELLILASVLNEENPIIGPMEILKYVANFGLNENFPNLCIAMRIALTLPVTVASGERSFSKLKLIKNYLRSTMSQERLNGLAIVSIEFDVLQNINVDELIKDFAEAKARRVFM